MLKVNQPKYSQFFWPTLQNVCPSSYSLSDEVTYFPLPKQPSTGDGKGPMPLRPPLFSCLRLSFLSEHAFAIFGFPIFREHCRSCRACFANIKVKAMFQGWKNAFWTLLVVSDFRDFPVLLACFSISRHSFSSLLSIPSKTPEKSLRIKMFQYSGWVDETDVPPCSGLISLIAKVERWQQHSGNGPITVVCRSVKYIFWHALFCYYALDHH